MSISPDRAQGRGRAATDHGSTAPSLVSRDSSAPKSQASTGIIHIQQTVTIEEIPDQNNASNNPLLFGDASQFYQATISAASQWARNLFSTTTLHNSSPDMTQTPARNKRWITVALLLASANLLSTIVDTMVAVMMPAMMYDMDVQGFQWALTGPAVGAAATILTAGQLYGHLPFKQVYALFASILLLGIVSPAFAPNMVFLFYARILLGMGLAGQQLGAVIFLDHDGTFTDKARRDFFISVSTAIGLILGPIVGASFARRGRFWKWAFYVAFAVMSLLMSALVYALPTNLHFDTSVSVWPSRGSFQERSRPRRPDVLGCGLSSVGLLTLFITFNLAGTWTSWTDTYLYVPIGISGLALLLLLIQQSFSIGTSPSDRLFPMEYLRRFKITTLFGLTFLVSGVLHTVLPYAALYQLLTRASPSPIMTATYLLFSLTGPHLIPTLLVPVYVGSGLVTSYPLLPSHSIWSLVTSVFLITGTALLFIDTPYFFPAPAGIPIIARQFSLACIGWWSAVTLSVAHQIIDVLQPNLGPSPNQRQAYHNRCFILFASFLGSAVALTTTGSIFMHLGPRWAHTLLWEQFRQSSIQDAVPSPTGEDALIVLLGYTFIREGTSAQAFAASLTMIRDAFGWSFVALLGFAMLAFISSVLGLIHKIWIGELDWRNRVVGSVPSEWRVEPVPFQPRRSEIDPAVELVERDGSRPVTMIENGDRGRPVDRPEDDATGSMAT